VLETDTLPIFTAHFRMFSFIFRCTCEQLPRTLFHWCFWFYIEIFKISYVVASCKVAVVCN